MFCNTCSADACLPPALARIFSTINDECEESAYSYHTNIRKFFPDEIGPLIDAEGKLWAHTVVVKLPFADPKELACSAEMPSPDEQELSKEEEVIFLSQFSH